MCRKRDFWLAVKTFVLLHIFLLEAADGFYKKGSNVVLIKDRKHFQEQVLNSDFLWVVEFYREGCGYCQLLTPEWEKVAENLKHMIYIAAVDTESNPTVAANHFDDQNPIKGVPTIKLYIPTSKKGKPKVITYNGERKAKAMVEFFTQHMPNTVITLKQSDGSHDRFLKDTSQAKVVFVTDRSYTSTMFKALSSEYKGRVLIGEARKSEVSVFGKYGSESLPALLQVLQDEHGNIMALMAYDFSQKNARSFVKISNWIWDCEREWKKMHKKGKSGAQKQGDKDKAKSTEL